MKKAKLLCIIISILLLCSLLLLTSCMGGGSSTVDDGESKVPEKYPDADKFPDDPDKDEQGKPESPGQPSIPSNPGDDDDLVDLSDIDVSKFKIVCGVEDPSTYIYPVADPYLGMYTKNLFYADITMYFTYEGLTDYKRDESRTDLYISASEERVTNDMTFYLSEEQSAYVCDEYLDDLSEYGFVDSVRALLEEAVGKEPSLEQTKEFIAENFTYSDFQNLIRDTISGEITLATSEEAGYTEFGLREAKWLDLSVKGTYTDWKQFEYGAVIPWENFNANEEVDTYYTDFETGDYEYVYFTFDGYENRELIKSFGFNYTDDGVIADDTFYNILSRSFDTEKYGMRNEFTIDCPDGTVQPIIFDHYIDEFEGVYYTITVPESASAPLDFENGMTYTFDVTISDKTYTVTHTTRYSKINPSYYQKELPGWIGKSGRLKELNGTETALTFTAPDSAAFTVDEVPVEIYSAQARFKVDGVFTFTYGDRTTTLYPDTESCCGVSYDSIVTYMRTVDRNMLLESYLGANHLEAKDTPHLVDCIAIRENYWANSISFTAYVTLIPTIHGISLANKADIGTQYYTGDEISIASGAILNVNGISSFYGEPYIIESVPVTKDMIDNFTTENEGEDLYMYVLYGGYTTMPIYYNVIKDYIVSIKVNTPIFLDVYIIDAPYSFDDFTIDATYHSGKTEEGIKMSADYVSAMPTTTGSHTMTVTYADLTDTFKLDALRAAEVKIQSGLGKYYIKDEKPREAVIYVRYETNSLGYDYDYIVVGEEVLSDFDTSTVGSKKWSYSYAGITISHSYEVKEGAYVVYTAGTENVTINGIAMTKDEIPDGSDYYSIKSFSELVIPATLNDLPVTKIASYAFEGLNMIQRVVIPEGVIEIGSYAFKDASGIKEVNIPLSAVTIGTKIFSGCTNIEKMTVNGNLTIESYFNKEMPTSLTVEFNEGVVSLVEKCLYIKEDGYTIAKVIFPSTLTTIEYGEDTTLRYAIEYAFVDVVAFECADGGYFSAKDGVLFCDDGKTLFCYPMNKTATSYTIPDGTEKVIFMSNNLNIKSIVIPASVKELGVGAFEFNENMTSVKFEGSLDVLSDSAFNYCTSLVTFNFPKGIKTIGEYALAYTSIPTVIVPDGVTTIGYSAFYMSKIQKLAIPSSAIDSFAELGYQCMNSLTDFAYDGSYQITKLKAIFDSFTKDALKNIYVYGVTSFKGGITARSRTYSIYIDESVKTIEYDDYESSGSTYYCAGSSIDNQSSNNKIYYNQSFNQWYEKG